MAIGLDPDLALVFIIVWSLFYAVLLGPWLSMHRMLQILPQKGPDVIVAILDTLDNMSATERKKLREALATVLGIPPEMAGGGKGFMPPKWAQTLMFVREMFGGGRRREEAEEEGQDRGSGVTAGAQASGGRLKALKEAFGR